MTAPAGSAPLDHDIGGRVDQVVDKAIEEERIVGAMILVAHVRAFLVRGSDIGPDKWWR